MNQNQTTLSNQELQEIFDHLKTHPDRKAKFEAARLIRTYPAAFATQAARGCPLVEYDRHDDHLPQALKGGRV